MRKRFLSRNRVHTNRNASYVDYRDYRRRRRHNMKALSKDITDYAQNTNDIESIDDELIFNMDE